MAPGRFVLRYEGQGAAPEPDVVRIAEQPGAAVVDRSERMVLVEGDEATLAALVEGLPGWAIAPEREYSLPDPRRRPHPT